MCTHPEDLWTYSCAPSCAPEDLWTYPDCLCTHSVDLRTRPAHLLRTQRPMDLFLRTFLRTRRPMDLLLGSVRRSRPCILKRHLQQNRDKEVGVGCFPTMEVAAHLLTLAFAYLMTRVSCRVFKQNAESLCVSVPVSLSIISCFMKQFHAT